jgi:glucosylceramidase
MKKLRPSANSFWLGCLVLACSTPDNQASDQSSTDPSGTGSSTTSSAQTSGTGMSGAVSPTTSTTAPVGTTGSVAPAVGPTASTVNPTPTTPGSGAVGPSGSSGPDTATTAPVGPSSSGVSPSGSTTDASTSSPPVNPEPDVPPPSLVVSSENKYWEVGEVTPVDAGTPNFTVTSATTHQTWHGWGGTFNEAGWDALQELSADDQAKAISLLFSTTDGLGLDWGRIPIGPSDYAIERYTLSDAPGQFAIDHDLEYLIPFVHAAQQVKNDVKYWASPWTPPPWAKTGGENGGYDKGVFNTEYYEEYADFFVSWIKAYEAEGIPIDAVMPQNEPGWAQSYPTCRFGPARDSTQNVDVGATDPLTLATFVDGHLFPKLDAASLATKVWFGTLSNNIFDTDHWEDMLTKPSANRIIGVGLQWETIAQVESVLAAGEYLVMQSEHRCGNYPWGTSESYITHKVDQMPSELAPNDFNYGQESWDLFVDWIKRGVHIYSAWNMVLDTHGTNLDAVRVWNQNALLVVDRDTNELKITPYYYVFRHLTQYVDVNAVRIEISGNALAFKNPDGSIVAVMRTAAAGNQIVSIDGTLLQFAATGNGWATVNWKPAQ